MNNVLKVLIIAILANVWSLLWAKSWSKLCC